VSRALVLMDVEGTTTSIRFVHDVLFPYSLARIESPEMKQMIREDKKDPALKEAQGRIWRAGYESGELKGHVYDDVPPAFRRWTRAGLTLGIYSSGSVLAQKLLFRHSVHGDLSPFLTHHFDTAVGHKRDPASYAAIARKVGLPPSSILFLSDVPEELAAAREQGYQVIQIVREGTVAAPGFEHAETFERI
jgi:enolase-phosphatase E1